MRRFFSILLLLVAFICFEENAQAQTRLLQKSLFKKSVILSLSKDQLPVESASQWELIFRLRCASLKTTEFFKQYFPRVLQTDSTGAVTNDESPAATISPSPTTDSSRPVSLTNAPTATVTPSVEPVHVATLTTSDLQEFADLSPAIQALIAHGLELTRLNLKYQYGSDDPQNGGMDCSGTVHYLLEQSGLKDVPRDASELYTWVWTKGHVEPVVSASADTFELDRLKPGDLLFWVGTYENQHDPPVSHVMIYLGTNRLNGRRVMVGASEGRTFEGKSRYGVSVFDFKLPESSRKKDVTRSGVDESESRFIGYGSVPGL